MGKSTEADLPVCVVEWDDAQGSATKAFTRADTPHGSIVMFTLGWLLQEDENGVSVACERYEDEGQEFFRGHTFIPKGMVRKLTLYRLSKPRKKAPDAKVDTQSPAVS